jgi:hypothetical protein
MQTHGSACHWRIPGAAIPRTHLAEKDPARHIAEAADRLKPMSKPT